jgi:hypothetical protein
MKMLYSSMNRTEVGLLKSILEGARIELEVRNEFTNANYPTAPFYPELWVIHDEDFDKAAELRDAWRVAPPLAQSAWSCPRCGEQLEAQFTSCWKCGASRGDVTPGDRP